jgi:hypothetical protein
MCPTWRHFSHVAHVLLSMSELAIVRSLISAVLDLNSNLRGELNRELSPEYQGISIP